MMPRRTLVLVAALLLVPNEGARAQTGAPPKSPPTGARWTVDASNDSCVMARQVADGPTTFAVMRYPGADHLRMRIIAPSLPKGLSSGDRKLRATLSPGTFSQEEFAGIFNMGSNKALQLWLPAAFLDALAGASSLRLSVRSREIAAYDVPQAAAVTGAFARCERGALLEWGADPASLEPGAVRPKAVGDDGPWVDKVLKGVMGNKERFNAVHRLTVGSDGRATACAPIGANVIAAASAKLCAALLANARYEPARDRLGKPVRAVAIHELSIETVTTQEIVG